jgi:coenzyme F420-0:L-glutamate ligase/coenzyme F420-1:gamma-L-glutamate ligase
VSRIELLAVEGLPEINPGDDLAAMITAAAAQPLASDDLLVVAHKIVSKAEGSVVELTAVEPSPRAIEIAERQGRDPRQVEVILSQSAEIIRDSGRLLICRTHHGLICANAGIDGSNSGAAGRLVLLPRDPDASARALRAALPGHPAVLITDSFGRAWRRGQLDVAIGLAGMTPLDDWRGREDSEGRPLRGTLLAVADQAAAAADLARTKDGACPAVIVRGLGRLISEDDGPGAQALLRPPQDDRFL